MASKGFFFYKRTRLKGRQMIFNTETRFDARVGSVGVG